MWHLHVHTPLHIYIVKDTEIVIATDIDWDTDKSNYLVHFLAWIVSANEPGSMRDTNVWVCNVGALG